MIKHLIYRPIGVLTITFGLMVLALFLGREVPVSLVPDVPIPRISIAISASNKTARIVENTIVRPLRNQLMQVSRLEDLYSSSRNGSAFIEVILETGSNTDLAFIEVNEKVDQAMNYLPRTLDRPRVVKSNVSDIPVFYLSMVPENSEETDILELSEFAEKVIKRRLEQLDEVAFADLHGIARPEIVVIPDKTTLQALRIREDQLALAIQNNNIDIGNVMLRDGQYQYNVEVGNRLESLEDLKSTLVTVNGQQYPLRSLAMIEWRPVERRSAYRMQDKAGIILSVRKKSGANNFDLQKSMDTLLLDFNDAYPQVNFTLVNDQSSLLEISYQNLRTSLGYGILFSCIILFLFFREWKMPLLIILTVPISLILTLLGFYLTGLTINIISLSGIILGVGLMIDNSIIIIDNIRQENESLPMDEAIVKGTTEVMRPLISSAATTCSVFLPLILLSGVAGALFYDQALSITLALTSSLLVSAIYLPVVTRLVIGKIGKIGKIKEIGEIGKIEEIKEIGKIEEIGSPSHKASRSKHGKFHDFHHRFLAGVLRWRWVLFFLFIVCSFSGYFLYQQLDRTSFPEITTDAIEGHIDWNQNISIEESEKRMDALSFFLQEQMDYLSAIIGEKQFLLVDEESGTNEAELFIQLKKDINVPAAIRKTAQWVAQQYPEAEIELVPRKNTFDYLFDQGKAPLIAYIQSAQQLELPDPMEMENTYKHLQKYDSTYTTPPIDEYLVVSVKEDLLPNYGVNLPNLISQLKTLFSANEVSQLRNTDRFVPIVLGENREVAFNGALDGAFILNKEGQFIPIKPLLNMQKVTYYKKIEGTMAGESLIADLSDYQEERVETMKQDVSRDGNFFVSFGGAYFETQALIAQLVRIILVVFILLYLILAAQFESFIHPLVVLIDVPLSMIGSLLFLYIGGASLNLVSMTGLIIMAGIIVNDAILKVDMINRNRKDGMSLDDAIIEGSSRRLRPIVMTSLTTILAFGPVLFSSGVGAEIQTPLALAVIGGLVVGTLSSLIFLPALYRLADDYLTLRKR